MVSQVGRQAFACAGRESRVVLQRHTPTKLGVPAGAGGTKATPCHKGEPGAPGTTTWQA